MNASSNLFQKSIIEMKYLTKYFKGKEETVLGLAGAGDLYAGGFLHGYTRNHNLETCGRIGSICAGQVVTQMGSRSNTGGD